MMWFVFATKDWMNNQPEVDAICIGGVANGYHFVILLIRPAALNCLWILPN